MSCTWRGFPGRRLQITKCWFGSTQQDWTGGPGMSPRACPTRCVWPTASAPPKALFRGWIWPAPSTAIGAAVTRFAAGDQVFGVGKGPFAEYARARESQLARKPANISFEQASVVPVSALHRPAGSPHRRTNSARAKGAGPWRLRRGRQLRRAAREGGRGRGHRRLQYRQDGPGARPWRRPRHRLHHAGLRGRGPSTTT